MSSVKIQSNVSGTGSLTIAAPNTNTDRTLTLPDESGTVLTSASPVIAQAGVPAFSAYATSATSTANAVTTKVLFQAEEFDATGHYDTATSRFTPNVAGYYLINAQVSADVSAGAYNSPKIYKNGALYMHGLGSSAAGIYYGLGVSALVYLNGSTDYVEIYFVQNTGVTKSTYTGQAVTQFQGVLVRAA